MPDPPRAARQVKESVNLVGTSLAYKVESEKNLTIQVVTTAGAGGATERSTDSSPPTTPQAAQSQSQNSSQSTPPPTITSQNSLMLRGTRKVLGSFGEALFIGAPVVGYVVP